MKIAWCIYGQPRLFRKGYDNIKAFLDNNSNVECDFFIHSWFDESLIGQYYTSSQYRQISQSELYIGSDTDTAILQIYAPKSHIFEKPRDFDISHLHGSIMYESTNEHQKNNINNCMSNIYSKYKVNQLLQEYIATKNTYYDLIISTRFDYLNTLLVDLQTLNPNKLNIIPSHSSKIILNDNYVIASNDIFNKYSHAFANIELFVNNATIMDICSGYTGSTAFVPEVVMFANMAYYYNYRVCYFIEQRDDMLNFI